MMKSTLAIFALCVAPLTACVAGAEQDWALEAELDTLAESEAEFDTLADKGSDGFGTEVTCVIPPAAHESVTLPTSGDVGNEISVTSPNGTYYPGHYVTEISNSGQPSQIAYAENVDLSGGVCSSNKVETEFFCYSTCWYRCGATTTTSGTLVSAPFGGSYCSASKGISVPAGVSKVRIKAKAYNSATPTVGARVLEGSSWHF